MIVRLANFEMKAEMKEMSAKMDQLMRFVQMQATQAMAAEELTRRSSIIQAQPTQA